MEKPNKPCLCGANDWRERPSGGFFCGKCHPAPASPVALMAEPALVASPLPKETPKYSAEVLTLRNRVIAGNEKLNTAWDQLCLMDHESQQWKDELERWHQANERLSILCTQLKSMGYDDCLYLDKDGKKAKSCLDEGIGCRVCPSRIPYWEKELMSLPSPKAYPAKHEESEATEFLKVLGRQE